MLSKVTCVLRSSQVWETTPAPGSQGTTSFGDRSLGCVSEHQRPSQNSAPKCRVVLKSKQSKNKLGVEESQVEEPHDLCAEVPIMAEIQL